MARFNPGALSLLVLAAAVATAACTPAEIASVGALANAASSAVGQAIKEGRTGAQANPNRPANADAREEGGPSAAQANNINNLPASAPGSKAGKTLLAMYVIGSDLEDGNGNHTDDSPLNTTGAATKDFNEVVEALKGLSPEERANVEILAYFGGANQPKWRGFTVVDGAGLIADSEDGYYGNHPDASIYSQVVAGGDMGAPETWEAFLAEVKAKQGGYAKVLVDVWNHGASWNGMGPDSNTKRVLAVDTLRAGLQKHQIKADLVGFDACLMASVEVAGAMAGHFDYLMASEELEPGHGWQYSPAVSFIGKNPNASVPDIAKVFIDQFVEHPDHKPTDGKTLSLVDLNRFQSALAPALAKLGSGLNYAGQITPYGQANGKAQRYGVHGGGKEVARDLGGVMAVLGTELPNLKATTDEVMAGLKSCVLYAREDGTKPHSMGLSLFSLENRDDFDRGYTRERAFPPELHSAFGGWFGAAAGDTSKPTLETLGASEMGPEARRLLQAEPGSEGIKVSDDVGIADVEEVHCVTTEAGFAFVGSAPSEELPGQDGVYRQSKWDGHSIHLVVGEQAVALATAEELGDDGFLTHTAPVVWNGEPATLFLISNAQNEVVNSWLQVYLPNGEPAREQRELALGDQIQAIRLAYTSATDELKEEAGEVVVLDGLPRFEHRMVDGGAFTFTLAEDLKGNFNNSDPVAVTQ